MNGGVAECDLISKIKNNQKRITDIDKQLEGFEYREDDYPGVRELIRCLRERKYCKVSDTYFITFEEIKNCLNLLAHHLSSDVRLFKELESLSQVDTIKNTLKEEKTLLEHEIKDLKTRLGIK